MASNLGFYCRHVQEETSRVRNPRRQEPTILWAHSSKRSPYNESPNLNRMACFPLLFCSLKIRGELASTQQLPERKHIDSEVGKEERRKKKEGKELNLFKKNLACLFNTTALQQPSFVAGKFSIYINMKKLQGTLEARRKMEKSWKFFNTQFSAVFLHSFLLMDSFLYRAICLGVVKKRTFSRCTRTFKDFFLYIFWVVFQKFRH